MGAACSSEVTELDNSPNNTLPSDDINNSNLLAISHINNEVTPIYKYNTGEDSWSEIGSIPISGCYHVTLAGGLFYFADTVNYTIYCYNPNTRSLRKLADLKDNPSHFCMAEFHGKLVIVGDYDAGKAQQKVYIWNADKWSWSALPDLLVGRRQAAAVDHDGSLYVAGGQIQRKLYEASFDTGAVERYDPRKRCWQRCANLIQPRKLAKLVSARGYLYCVGGEIGDIPTNMVERYDPRINKWIELSCMSSPKIYMGCIYFQKRLLVTGGPSLGDDTWEEYAEQRNAWIKLKDTDICRPKNLFVVSTEFLQKLQAS